MFLSKLTLFNFEERRAFQPHLSLKLLQSNAYLTVAFLSFILYVQQRFQLFSLDPAKYYDSKPHLPGKSPKATPCMLQNL